MVVLVGLNTKHSYHTAICDMMSPILWNEAGDGGVGGAKHKALIPYSKCDMMSPILWNEAGDGGVGVAKHKALMPYSNM